MHSDVIFKLKKAWSFHIFFSSLKYIDLRHRLWCNHIWVRVSRVSCYEFNKNCKNGRWSIKFYFIIQKTDRWKKIDAPWMGCVDFELLFMRGGADGLFEAFYVKQRDVELSLWFFLNFRRPSFDERLDFVLSHFANRFCNGIKQSTCFMFCLLKLGRSNVILQFVY